MNETWLGMCIEGMVRKKIFFFLKKKYSTGQKSKGQVINYYVDLVLNYYNGSCGKQFLLLNEFVDEF